MGSNGEGPYSKLMDDFTCSEFNQHERTREVRPRGPCRPPAGSLRVVLVFLTVSCLLLLVCVIALASQRQGESPGEGGSGRQEKEVNVTSLVAALQRLQKENQELLAKLAPPTAPACPQGWLLFQGSCFLVSRRSDDWRSGQASCAASGGHLAIVTTAETQGFLWDLLPPGHWNAFWIGLTDASTEDQWKWVDGTPLDGGFWEEGEPNNHIDEDCGYMVKTRVKERVAVRSWYDAPCDMRWPFICQKTLGSQ